MDGFIWRISERVIKGWLKRRGNVELVGKMEEIGDEDDSDCLKEEVEEIRMAIAQLPPIYAEVLSYHLGDYSSKEIGKLLGCSDSTVRWRLSQAIKKLKNCLIKGLPGANKTDKNRHIYK